MENDDTKNDGRETSGELTPAPNVENKQTKKPNKSNSTSQKTKEDKKKSYRRSWGSASPLKKMEIILLGIGAAVGVGYLGVTFWGKPAK